MATIKSKLITNVIFVILTVVAIVGMNFLNLKEITQLQKVGAMRASDAVKAKEASYGGAVLYQVIADAIINRDLTQTEKEWGIRKEQVIKRVEEVLKSADTAEEKAHVEEVKGAVLSLIRIFEEKMLPALRTADGVTAEVKELDGSIDMQAGKVEAGMDKVVASLEKEMKASDEELHSNVRKTVTQALIIGLVGILIQAALAGWLSRNILASINSMVAMLKDVAEGEGDLTKRLDESTKDEIALASHWFNVFIEKVQTIIGRVAQNSTQLASAATQLHATSEQIATGAEEVARQTCTVATASEEMAATSNDIALTCHHAAESARLASGAAENGSAVVQLTVEGMQKIARRVEESARTVESLGARSDQIGAIIGTIEDIADQTNLLALNAAIEAARAGEQGRGFAVVADEVRALAERTTKATKEIGEMIKSIQSETRTAVNAMKEGVQEVGRGTDEAAKSGLALAQILEQIVSVNQQVAQIATAAEEQTATTSEITNNIQQVTEVVQSTAKGAIDSAEAAAQVNSLSGELHALVRRFKT